MHMIRLELEALLEGGLYALGAELGQREYQEQIRLRAQVDDNSRPRRPLEEFTGFDRLNEVVKWSYYQLAVEAGPYFFIRQSKPRNGLTVEYLVRPTIEGVDEYEPRADEIVRNRRIAGEDIIINREGVPLISLILEHGKHGKLILGISPVDVIQMSDLEFSTKLRGLFEMLGFDLAKVNEVEGSFEKEFDGNFENIYHAVIDFLR